MSDREREREIRERTEKRERETKISREMINLGVEVSMVTNVVVIDESRCQA